MLRVTQSFFADSKFFSAGDLVNERDNVVKGREHLFEKVDAQRAPSRSVQVEEATAEPGVKRTVKRAAKKAV